MTPQGAAREWGPLGVLESWTTPCLASLSPRVPSLTSQQEDTNKDKWLLYKVSISDSSILYRVGLGPLLLPFLLPSTSRPHEMLGRVKSPPLRALLPTDRKSVV